MAVIGYARISTAEQNLDLQRRALRSASCDLIFEDHGISATSPNRPGFAQALNALSRGDVLVVWKMDRAFRSLKQALDMLEIFEAEGIELRCLTEAIDTTTPMGKCMFQVRNAFAELERNFISERTIAGMDAARRRGVRIGRPPKLSDEQIAECAMRLVDEPGSSLRDIADQLGVSSRTLSRAIAKERLPEM